MLFSNEIFSREGLVIPGQMDHYIKISITTSLAKGSSFHSEFSIKRGRLGERTGASSCLHDRSTQVCEANEKGLLLVQSETRTPCLGIKTVCRWHCLSFYFSYLFQVLRWDKCSSVCLFLFSIFALKTLLSTAIGFVRDYSSVRVLVFNLPSWHLLIFLTTVFFLITDHVVFVLVSLLYMDFDSSQLGWCSKNNFATSFYFFKTFI